MTNEGFVEIDMDAVRRLKAEEVTPVIDYFASQVNSARSYVRVARDSGITHNILAGLFCSYDTIQEAMQCLASRESLTAPQKARLEDMAGFWKDEEKLIRNGFYHERTLSPEELLRK